MKNWLLPVDHPWPMPLRQKSPLSHFARIAKRSGSGEAYPICSAAAPPADWPESAPPPASGRTRSATVWPGSFRGLQDQFRRCPPAAVSAAAKKTSFNYSFGVYLTSAWKAALSRLSLPGRLWRPGLDSRRFISSLRLRLSPKRGRIPL